MSRSFKSWRSYHKFSSYVKTEYRYIQTDFIDEFLKTLLETSKNIQITIDKGSQLYRSQKGYDEQIEGDNFYELPYSPKRMIPQADKIGNGRINSIGIPCLYLADELETAISESRPWINEKISIAVFSTIRDLKIIDLSNIKKSTKYYFKEPEDPLIRNKEVWSSVGSAFSQPVSLEDQDRDYIPTQIISEYFKCNGFDGIKYKSFLSNGNNYSIFNINDAIPENGVVYEIKGINYKYDQYSNPVDYDIKKNERIFNSIIDYKKC